MTPRTITGGPSHRKVARGDITRRSYGSDARFIQRSKAGTRSARHHGRMHLTRREALAGAGGALVAGAAAQISVAEPRGEAVGRAFAGGRQPGILTQRQDHLT